MPPRIAPFGYATCSFTCDGKRARITSPARRSMVKPILVTGGCGFIGSNYIRYLLDNDPETPVVNLDALTYAGNPANLSDLVSRPRYAGRYRFVHGDITDRDAVRLAIGSGVQAI